MAAGRRLDGAHRTKNGHVSLTTAPRTGDLIDSAVLSAPPSALAGHGFAVTYASRALRLLLQSSSDKQTMIRKAAGILAGLGLIGGAGSVVYDHHGNATVKITNKSGQVQTVHIGGAGGRMYSCSARTNNELSRYDIALGRIKLTLKPVRRSERQIGLRYPGHQAPDSVVRRFNALVRRDRQLVRAYNKEVAARNAILVRDCSPQ